MCTIATTFLWRGGGCPPNGYIMENTCNWRDQKIDSRINRCRIHSAINTCMCTYAILFYYGREMINHRDRGNKTAKSRNEIVGRSTVVLLLLDVPGGIHKAGQVLAAGHSFFLLYSSSISPTLTKTSICSLIHTYSVKLSYHQLTHLSPLTLTKSSSLSLNKSFRLSPLPLALAMKW